jgi:hypothetical protein
MPLEILLVILYIGNVTGRSQWPRGLRRGSASAHLVGLRVRILPGAWMPVVTVVFCQVEVSATNISLVHISPTESVCMCVSFDCDQRQQ